MAAAMALPGTAFADATVNFDDLAAGTTVTNQYANLGGAGQGVRFGPLPGSGGSGWNPVVRTPPSGQAQSGANVADIDTAPGVEFPSPVTTGTFAVPRSQVSVDVGWLDDPEPCSDPSTDNGCAVVTLTGYDANGNVVATSAPGTVTAGGGVHTLLSISATSATIVGFKIAGRGSDDEFKQIAIDDLSFNTPTTPPAPDFTLTPAQTTVNVTDGASATDTIAIGRLTGSSGDVDLAVSGTLPAGVNATISPAQASGTTSTLTLSADPDAAVSPTAGTITVTGTPSGSAVGSAPRSFDLTIGVQGAFAIFAGGPANVSISACTASVPLFLTRSLAFNGQVSLSVTGLPPGVQASFSSNPVTFPTGEGQTTAELALTAAHNGQVELNRTVTVTASDPPLANQTTTFIAGGTCPLQYDAQVTSIQITQGVQSPFLPAQNYTTHPASVVPYSEIPNAAELRAGGPTVVRVYADLAFGPSGGVPNIPAELIGYTHNEIGSVVPLPGSPLLPTSPPRTLQVGPATATAAEEGSETEAYTFTLPPSWTHGTITVGGVVLPAQAPPVVAAQASAVSQHAITPNGPVVAPCDTTPCNENDALTLSAIPFYDAPTVTIDPVQLQVNGAALPNPTQVFQWARLVTPLKMQVEPYQGTIDITDLSNTFHACTGSSCSDNANDAASSRFDDWVCDNGAPDFGWDIGVNTGVARGLTNHDDICWSEFNGYQDSVVEYKRPLTSVAHEFFHLLGRPHASDCNGGGSNGQTAESWPPDQMGYTQSVGLDTTLGSGLNGGPYAIPSPPGATWYDFMSYCASGAHTSSPLTLPNAPAWGSTHNWNAVMESFRYHGVRQPLVHASVASAPQPSLLVNAYLQHGGPATIDSVTPLKTVARTVADSGFELVGLDAAGHQVASSHMAVETLHVDGEAPPLGLEGAIPAARVASVEVVIGGTVVATRHQSAHPPSITMRGAPVASHGTTTIRWRAHDADHDRLLAEIDYSRNDGRTYRRLWIGPNHDVARLPSRYLSRSARARITVTVNDGFRSASAHSRRFIAPGAGPVVTILSPHRGAHEPDDAALVLSGQAFDDAGRSLTGGRLRWFEGPRLLGSGAQIASAGLKPGRDRITLVARDGAGRLGRASVTVSLSAARPLFLVLSAPRQVKRTARVVKLKVSSSLQATLAIRTGVRAKAQRFDVSRTLRTLSVKIAKGSTPLTLRVSLAAGGLTRTATVSVTRS